ncbi:MAG: ferritin-like domain-containing protein [Salinisphaeraceae bacterium]|nr:ferritin-like domain-containing protein [Salinisphaeraceae bacterium]
MTADLFQAVERALSCNDPAKKCEQVRALSAESLAVEAHQHVMTGLENPGRPERPILVDPAKVPKRRLHTAEGRAALIHAVAHIEFNAINLALDAVWRFRGMPVAFYNDWLSVASDEARHFGWLSQRLDALGFAYGDFKAHNGLWEMACKTADDPLKRMALVPRVLEARGLDVTPGMIKRLHQAGDEETAAILVQILREEEDHVAIGSRWYGFLCRQRHVDPEARFEALLDEFNLGIKPPLNEPARLRGGFSKQELQLLKARV